MIQQLAGRDPLLVLVWIVVFVVAAAIVLWLIRLILRNLPIDATIQNIIVALFGIIALLVFLRWLGLF